MVVVVVAAVGVTMSVRVAHSEEADKVDEESENTDYEELIQPSKFMALPESLKRVQYDLEADETATIREFSGLLGLMTYMRKIPFPNPDSVSTLPYPYGNRALAGHLLMTAAIRPTASPAQSKNMWILSVSRPREPVTKP